MFCIFLLAKLANCLNFTWAAVMIDTRFDAAVVASISNARHHIPRHIAIYVLTDAQNWRQIKQVFDDMPNLRILDRSFDATSVQAYNELLLSKEFWNLFKEEYILVFHRDSRFCAYSQQRIERYVGHYDYIGAPWVSEIAPGVQVGNGGFSLRCRNAMLLCCESPMLALGLNEDGSMTICLQRYKMRLPSVEIASEFAVETVRFSYKTPLAVHKVWHYIKNDHELARYCPESVQIL